MNRSVLEKLWSGRFNAPTHELVESFNASIEFDQLLVMEDILGSLAHVETLRYHHILSEEDHQAITVGLRRIVQKFQAGALTFQVGDEDIHMNIERQLYHIIGEVAGKLHTARSRNDQVALDIHLYLRQETLTLIHLLLQLQNTLMTIADAHQKVMLPGYTHLQRAQPVSLATHFLAYVSMFQRDIDRLQDGWKRVNVCPLGAGALAGSSFGIDRHGVANLLNFDGIYLNTMDAVSDRDFIVEFLASSSLLMMHISKLSEELILWSSQEFNFICFEDAFCTGSSMMPQKKNPDIPELARGKTGRVYGALMSLLTLLKGLPLAYNKDLQEDKEPLFDTVKTLKKTLLVYIPLLKSTKFLTDQMTSATRSGFLNATFIAEYFVKQGFPFRQAHEIVGKMVRYALEKKCQLESLTLEEIQLFSHQITADMYASLLTSLRHAANHQLTNLKQEFSIRRQQLLEMQQWLGKKQQKVLEARKRFLGEN